MQYDRHDRVKSLITELVAEFIRDEANTDPLITVTNLDISPDYRHVQVYVTTLPEDRQNDAVIFLKRKGGELRTLVKRKSNLKIIPFFDFAVDYGERHRQHIDEIVREIEEKKND